MNKKANNYFNNKLGKTKKIITAVEIKEIWDKNKKIEDISKIKEKALKEASFLILGYQKVVFKSDFILKENRQNITFHAKLNHNFSKSKTIQLLSYGFENSVFIFTLYNYDSTICKIGKNENIITLSYSKDEYIDKI
jgi:hypothetical protein